MHVHVIWCLWSCDMWFPLFMITWPYNYVAWIVHASDTHTRVIFVPGAKISWFWSNNCSPLFINLAPWKSPSVTWPTLYMTIHVSMCYSMLQSMWYVTWLCMFPCACSEYNAAKHVIYRMTMYVSMCSEYNAAKHVVDTLKEQQETLRDRRHVSYNYIRSLYSLGVLPCVLHTCKLYYRVCMYIAMQGAHVKKLWIEVVS